MLQRILSATLLLLAGLTLSASVPAATPAAPGTDAPAPFTLQGTPRVLGGGMQQAWRVKVDEDRAMQAIFKGGMWLPNGAGGREYARYSSHILHPDGSWTWIGKVATAHGEQSVVITFGKDAVFGRIPQSNDYPLRLETEHGVVSLVRTSGAAISRSATAVAMRATTDARTLPRRTTTGGAKPAAAGAQTQKTTGAASTNAATVIDVMVAYTPGIVSEYGSTSAALTRINNLVAIANQAYSDSQVNQRIRLVNTVEVNYPDNTSNDSALDDITGYDSNGNPVTIPPSLSQIHSLRAQYGADLVSLLRRYNNATNGGCGLSWIIGGNLQPIVPSQDYIYGYSVVGDGSDGTYYCLDTSFAHELGHNMGDEHDRANADQPGAYSYSYGFKSTSPTGFATVMAYGDPQQTPLAVFSNPNISICQNQPCGVADSSSNSADNAHSMNNTAALIAQFETAVPRAHNDVDADGLTDFLWRSVNQTQFAYWVMDGATLVRGTTFNTASNLRVLASGDFNGDGYSDILWSDGSNLWVWIGNGTSFTNTFLLAYPAGGWTLVGAADVDGDGKTDLLWVNGSSRLATWLMNGASVTAGYSQSMPAGWRVLTTGDFDGDGKADVLWVNGASMQMWTQFSNGAYTPVATRAYPGGWSIAGSGDINGDGMDDLLWRDNAHQYFAYWLMNGGTLTQAVRFNVGPTWTLGTTGTFNDDGFLDIVWNSSSTIELWSGNGSGFTGQVVRTYPGGWTMLK